MRPASDARPILITGGAGFIGSNLADRLAVEGHEIIVFDSLVRPGVERNLAWLKERHGKRITALIGDVRDEDEVVRAVAEVKAVFHFAAQVAVTTSLGDPREDFDVNVRGTINVLDAVRMRREAAPVIFSSTNKVYGDLGDMPFHQCDDHYRPTGLLAQRGIDERRPLDFHTPYGCSKGSADQYVLDYCRSFAIPTLVFRMSCIYGQRQMGTEDQGWVAHFLIRALEGKPITIYGDGKQVRDVLDVGDAVNAYVAALDNIDRVQGRAFNLGGGPDNAISLLQLSDEIRAATGSDVELIYEDWRQGDQRWYVSDTRAAGSEARWPRPLGVETLLVVVGPSPSTRQRDEASEFKLIDTGLPLDWSDTSADELRNGGKALALIAAREGADVVQTCSAALLADVEFDQPCVAVQHSCVASWWAAVEGKPLAAGFAWRRDLVERGLRRAAEIVAPTTAFAAETARIYPVDAPVLAVHNGRCSPTMRALEPSPFVFTASRLWDAGKNVPTLDAAAAMLDVPFEAAGALDGPNGASTELRNIHVLGELSPARLAGLFAARPIFASAALYEPFGLAALEAAQAGCALVLSDIPTHRELWGAAALFVPARDAAGFAAAIQFLLDNPQERAMRGQLARTKAELYTPERMARAMAQIYARVAQPQLMAQPLAGAA